MPESALNDVIHEALTPTYGPADVTTMLGLWMDDQGIPRWNSDAMRTFFLSETGASPLLSTNDLMYLYFSGDIGGGGNFRLLESGDRRLLETGDFRLLES